MLLKVKVEKTNVGCSGLHSARIYTEREAKEITSGCCSFSLAFPSAKLIWYLNSIQQLHLLLLYNFSDLPPNALALFKFLCDRILKNDNKNIIF